MYEKQDHPYNRLDSLRSYYIDQTVIRYNLITNFLNGFSSKSEQDFAAYLIKQLLPSISTEDLKEYDHLLNFVKEQVQKANLDLDFSDSHKQTLINDLRAANANAMAKVLEAQEISLPPIAASDNIDEQTAFVEQSLTLLKRLEH